MKNKERFEYWLLGVLSVPALWFIASYIDVVLHNCDLNPVYQWWNLFAIAVGY